MASPHALPCSHRPGRNDAVRFGVGYAYRISTEGELESALRAARTLADDRCILELILEPNGISPALQRLTRALAKRVRAGEPVGPSTIAGPWLVEQASRI
jgi:hypothetical protein